MNLRLPKHNKARHILLSILIWKTIFVARQAQCFQLNTHSRISIQSSIYPKAGTLPFTNHRMPKHFTKSSFIPFHKTYLSSTNQEFQENSVEKSYPNSTLSLNTTNTNLQNQSTTNSITNEAASATSDAAIIMENDNVEQGRQMQLSWCTREGCHVETTIRETVEGPNNHISFQGPATGQVTYNWVTSDNSGEISDNETNNQKPGKKNPTVLLLVKRDDEDLLKVAADAVRALTSKDNGSNIDVLLFPECAAKLKYNHGVDDDHHIQLFEPEDVQTFGSDICSFDIDSLDMECQDNNPDLICTLGGDGLLMYASSLFPGPVPPILCIAGGSLGFLTPFSRDEMVEAIQHALGFIAVNEDAKDSTNDMISSPLSITNGDKIISIDTWNNESANIEKKTFSFSQYGICISMRMRLDCRVVNREGVTRARYNVLNEVVIDRGSSPFLSNLECFCDNVHLTTVQADGIIFST